MSWLQYFRDISIFFLVSSAIVFGLYYVAAWLRSRGQGKDWMLWPDGTSA